MSHLVESMAYTNEVPWHGLGFNLPEAPTVKGMLKAAKLDWQVERRPMYLADGSAVEGFAALTRDRDNAVLDVVGSRYLPTQNEEAFSFFKEFVEAGGAKMETAGSLKGGRMVWGLASLNSSFKLKGNDEVKGYLLIANPHEQGKSLVVKFTTVRVVCNNTITLALREKGATEFRMNHRRSFDDITQTEAKEALGIARDQLGEFERNARLLQKLRLSRSDVIKILAPIYQPQAEVKELIADFDEKASSRMKLVMDVYARAPGAQEGNGWGALNAVTYYADHLASRTADKRLTNAWMGKTANQKQDVFSTLLEMAD